MAQFKEQKIEELLAHLAAEYLRNESNRTSLITVTGAKVSSRFTKVTIMITVFPETKEVAALDFVRRQRREFKEYLKSHSRLQRLPLVDFEIDLGEKNRQRIDELGRS